MDHFNTESTLYFISLLVLNEKGEMAIEVARNYCLKIERTRGYQNHLTWKPKQYFFTLLLEFKRVREALEVAREHSLKMGSNLGYRNTHTQL